MLIIVNTFSDGAWIIFFLAKKKRRIEISRAFFVSNLLRNIFSADRKINLRRVIRTAFAIVETYTI